MSFAMKHDFGEHARPETSTAVVDGNACFDGTRVGIEDFTHVAHFAFDRLAFVRVERNNGVLIDKDCRKVFLLDTGRYPHARQISDGHERCVGVVPEAAFGGCHVDDAASDWRTQRVLARTCVLCGNAELSKPRTRALTFTLCLCEIAFRLLEVLARSDFGGHQLLWRSRLRCAKRSAESAFVASENACARSAESIISSGSPRLT